MATNITDVGIDLEARLPFSYIRNVPKGSAAWPLDSTGHAWDIATDVLLVFLSGVTTYCFRYGTASMLRHWQFVLGTDGRIFREYMGGCLLYAALAVLFCHAKNLYDPMSTRSLAEESVAVVKALSWATLVLLTFLLLDQASIVSRFAVLLNAVLTCSVLLGRRYGQRKIAERRFARGIGVRNVLIVGAGKIGRALAGYLTQSKHLGYAFRGFLDQNDADPSVLGRIEDLPLIARAHFVDAVFITIPDAREVVKQIALAARHLRIGVKVIPELYDGIGWRAPAQCLGDFPIRVLHHEPVPWLALLIKRVIDVACSAIALVLLSPVLALLAVLIKIDSPGPVFYHSERVGKKGRPFLCHKFRTMVENAEVLKTSIEHLNERESILFKVTNDPRVTRFGRFLRKYSLDELPQLWNVLTGNMSLVGPRPAIPSEFQNYDPEHFRRLEMTPGLTGLWQVTARNDPSFETYVSLDLHYIENWSPLLDLKLVLKTIPAVLSGTGS